MNVYIITSGELDSFAVVGFCTTEEQAKKTCAKMNANLQDYNLISCVDYSELECLDGISKQDFDVYFRYNAEIEQTKKTGEVFVKRVRCEFITSEYIKPKFIETSHDGPKYKFWQFNFCLGERNDKCARKVAEDASKKYFRLLAQ